MPAISAMRFCMASRCGPMRGASHTTVALMLAMTPPRARTRSTAWRRNRSDEAPFHCMSEGGKCEPMSPSPIVASSASVRACSTTSASEWPLSCARVRDPHATEPHVVALDEGVDVEALAGADVGARSWVKRSSAASRSEVVVILTLPGSPSKTATGWPANSATPASSVRSCRSSAAARAWAALISPKRKDCGVCTAAQAVTVGGAGDAALGVDRLHRVEDRAARHGGAGAGRRRDGAGHELGRREGPRAVVDQHEVAASSAAGRQGLEAPRARCPAGSRRPSRAPPDRAGRGARPRRAYRGRRRRGGSRRPRRPRRRDRERPATCGTGPSGRRGNDTAWAARPRRGSLAPLPPPARELVPS